MTPRIVLQYPGGEVTVFAYKRAVPLTTIETKLADVATTLFPSWEWGDGDIPAIDAGDKMLIAVTGPSGKACFL